MLDQITIESFESLLGQTFETSGLSLTLIEVSRLGEAINPIRGSWGFSLIFHGPSWPILRQQIHRLKTPDLGELDLFIVPLGPDPRNPQVMRYEIIFN